MPLPTHVVSDLSQSAAFSFGSWPNSAVPTFGAGVYTVWHNDGRFICVGMSGRGITAEQFAVIHPTASTHASKAMRVDAEAATSSACM